MALFEYVTTKLAKKGLASDLVKLPYTLLKAVVTGMGKWGLWVFNQLVPTWMRIILFFVVLYVLISWIGQLLGHPGLTQFIGEILNLL